MPLSGLLHGSLTPGEGRPPGDPRAVLTSLGVALYDWDIDSDEIAWGANAGEVLGLPFPGGGAPSGATSPS